MHQRRYALAYVLQQWVIELSSARPAAGHETAKYIEQQLDDLLGKRDAGWGPADPVLYDQLQQLRGQAADLVVALGEPFRLRRSPYAS